MMVEGFREGFRKKPSNEVAETVGLWHNSCVREGHEMNIFETKVRIARGVCRHIAQKRDMGAEPADALEVMQVAFQVLDALCPGATDANAPENREFVVMCGFTAEDALRVIGDDDQPNAIY